MSESGSEIWLYGTWLEALRAHPLFSVLSDESGIGEGTLLLCETRGDLFVWSSASSCLLTTNLKRIYARRNEAIIFQHLHPTIIPATPPVRLIPSPAGQNIAVVGKFYVNIMELRRQRGPNGEFCGGVKEADCRTVPIANTLIRAHHLEVLQVEWHQDQTGIIAVLTKDGGLRLFSLNKPNVPQLTLRVSLIETFHSHALRLEEAGSVIAFSIFKNKIILLQDRMELQIAPLKEGGQPSSPLRMYPVVEDNYSGRGCDMLLLSMYPPVVVLASDNGRLLHCVYINAEEQGDSEEDEGIISVIENISLPQEESIQVLKLISDPVSKYSYCVMTCDSVFHIQVPWLNRLEQFNHELLSLKADPPSIINQLIRCLNQDLADSIIVSDSLLGSVAISIMKDGTCLPVSLMQHPGSYLDQGSITDHSTPLYALSSSDFVQHIHDVLTPQQQFALPQQHSHKEGKQKECFEFLKQSLILLRKTHLEPQIAAKAELHGRVQLLTKRRNRQVTELVSLEDEVDEVDTAGQNLMMRLENVEDRCHNMIESVERVLGQITMCSSVLSDAEKTMARDLQSIQEQLASVQRLLQEAESKVTLGFARSRINQIGISASNLDTILTSLSDDGTTIKQSMKIVKELASHVDITTTKT